MKILPIVQRLTVMTSALLMLSGCTNITIEFDFHPDFSTDFSESIWLDQDLSGYMGTSQTPGDADYWSHMRRLAQTFGWTCKEKASNHLVLSGSCPNGQQDPVAKQLANQIAVFAVASGVPADATLVGPTVLKYRAVKKENFFTVEDHFNVDLDLTTDTARKFMAMPPHLAKLLNDSGKSRERIKIDVKAKFPIAVLSTNGKLESKSNAVTWPVYVGQLNHFEIAFLIIKWPMVAIVVAAVVSVVFGSIFGLIALSGRRRAS